MMIVLLGAVIACDSVLGLSSGEPGHVDDLAVTATAAGSVSLQWTEVSDGRDEPARYLIAYAAGQIEWNPLTTSVVEVPGDSVGKVLDYTLDNLNRGAEYHIQLVSYRGQVDSLPVFGDPSNEVIVTTEADPPTPVDNLSLVTKTSTSISVTWTEVDDGTGQPATYLVGIGSPTIDWVVARPTALLVAGQTIGGSRTVTISGLTASTTYQIQVASFRGTPALADPLDALSNVLTQATDAAGGVAAFFTDGFDAGVRTNANGFTWSTASSRVQVSTEQKFSGTHSLKFRFGPDTLGGDSSAEQRFNLGQNVTEIWVEYMLFVPANYVHRNDSPANNKFIRIWGDDYGATNKVGASTWTNGGFPIGSSIRIDRTTTSGIGPSGGGPTNSVSPVAEFLANKGGWTRVRMHFKHTTTYLDNNAVAEIWFGDTRVLFWDDMWQLVDATRPYWNQGYLLGWSNSGFTQETSFYIDDVKFFNANPGW